MKTKFMAPSVLALAIAQLCAGRAAWADSGLGSDTVFADALNRRGPISERYTDERGKSLIIPELMRTPGGMLYSWPLEPLLEAPFGDGWSVHADAEAGALAKDRSVRAAQFNQRRDWRNGLLLNNFNVGLENQALARYLELGGAGLARDDQVLRAAYGHYNDFAVRGFFNELWQPFAGNARTFFDGAGTGMLSLKSGYGLAPGGAGVANSAAAKSADALNMERALQGVPVGLSRKKAGAEFESRISDELTAFMRYSVEKREGERPFGATMGFVFNPQSPAGSPGGLPGASTLEVLEPVDYRTHDVNAALRWARGAFQANASYTGSFFRNHIDALTWEHPYSSANGPGILRLGRIDLAPDNNFNQIRLELARAALPMRGQLGASLSRSSMRQDDDLLAPVANSGNISSTPISAPANVAPFTSQGTASASPTLNANLWNTTDALSQKSAHARIDTTLAQLTGSIQPLDALTVRAKARHYREDNKTRYVAYNPLTGQYGYVALDGGMWVNAKAFSGLYSDSTGTLATPSGNIDVVRSIFPIRYRNIPFEYSKTNYTLEGDYRVGKRSVATLLYEREQYKRAWRERERTWEDRLRLALNTRELEWATVRLSYEYGKRAGGQYNYDPYRQFMLAPPVPLVSPDGANSGNLMLLPPYTLAQLRKLDLSDRKQHVMNARMNFIVRSDMDLMLSAKLTKNDYGAQYGRTSDRVNSYNVDWSWNLGPRAAAWAHYSFQRSRQDQANINDTSAYFLGDQDPNAGGANYPLTGAWSEASRDDSNNLGIGARYGRGKFSLESDFSMTYSKTGTAYTYASAAALVPAPLAQVGSGMPDGRFRQNAIETTLRYRIARNMSWRLLHRYERASFSDWHYDGLAQVYNNAAFLGAGPERYGVHIVGILFQYSVGGTGP